VIGTASTLSPEPSLVKIGTPIIIEKKTYMPLGKIRYSYGRGFWEEYFLKGEDSREYWLSIDEGDFALEKPMNIPLSIHSFDELRVGAEYGKYIVIEIGEGKCVGFEGELPKLIGVGDKHNYAHLSKGGTSLITVEFRDKQIKILDSQVLDESSEGTAGQIVEIIKGKGFRFR